MYDNTYTLAPTKEPKYSVKIEFSFHTALEYVWGFSIRTEQPFCINENEDRAYMVISMCIFENMKLVMSKLESKFHNNYKQYIHRHFCVILSVLI